MNKNSTFENFLVGLLSILAIIYIIDAIFNEKKKPVKKDLTQFTDDGFEQDAKALFQDRMSIEYDFKNAHEKLLEKYELQ